MPQPSVQQAFDLALRHHQAGRLQEAEQLYRQILASQPQHAAAIHHLGVIALQFGHNDMAVDLIRRALAVAPDYAEAHCNLGNALKNVGRPDEAIAAYRRAIALKPDLPEAHTNLGCRLKDKGQLDQAIASHRTALALRPNYADALNNLGNALIEKGQVDGAIAACRSAIASNPNMPEAYCNLANALQDKRQFAEAIAANQTAIALRGASADAHYNLGNALSANGQLDEAIAAFRQAIALKPDYPEAHLGIALQGNGQLDEAIAEYNRALQLKPDYVVGYETLAAVLAYVGRVEEAIAALRLVIKLQPDRIRAHARLPSLLMEQGQFRQAADLCRTLIQLRPDDAASHSLLALALRQCGQAEAPDHGELIAAHSGDLGDIIYALPTLRRMGRCTLVLFPDPKTRCLMDRARCDLLKPLLMQQPYIKDVQFSERIVQNNMTGFRHFLRLDRNIAEAHLAVHGFPAGECGTRWIDVDKPSNVAEAIFSRSGRYQNSRFPWQRIVEKYEGKSAFVGMPDEHEAFCRQFGRVPYVPTSNLLELARAIAGSRLFVGNQSCPAAIAEGLKHRMILEVSPKVPNCNFVRAGRINWAGEGDGTEFLV